MLTLCRLYSILIEVVTQVIEQPKTTISVIGRDNAAQQHVPFPEANGGTHWMLQPMFIEAMQKLGVDFSEVRDISIQLNVAPKDAWTAGNRRAMKQAEKSQLHRDDLPEYLTKYD